MRCYPVLFMQMNAFALNELHWRISSLYKHQLTVNVLTYVYPPSAEKEITCGWMCPSIALSSSAAQPDGSPIRYMSRWYLEPVC